MENKPVEYFVNTQHRTSGNSEAGQALLLVILGMGIFLLGAAGLALDGSNLYANRQMAQAAADAGAEAGALSIFDGSNAIAGNTHGFATNARFTCASSDARTPCYYAQTMNGFNQATDTVTVDFPGAAAVGVPTGSLSASDAVNLLRVTVSRQVNTTLLALVGPGSSTVSATGTTGLVTTVSQVPLLITHPTLANALSMNGTTNITITGGPQRSIQVNSNNASAYTGGGSVDLSGGGPNGTGSNFGVFGGAAAKPASVSLGTTGRYISPSSPIQDPLAGVPAPAIPAASTTPNGQACTVLGHCADCPGAGLVGHVASCIEFVPGAYPKIDLKNVSSAIFDPGVYYIQGGGFNIKHSTAAMCTSCAADPTTKNGLVMYDAGATAGSTATGGFSIDTQGELGFLGAGVTAATPTAAPAAPYYGIMFFEQRNADAQSHSLGQGNSCFSFVGIIYITNTLAIMQADGTHYQSATMNGGPCAGLNNVGGFILNSLSIVGNTTINMSLFPAAFINVRQIALVQ